MKKTEISKPLIINANPPYVDAKTKTTLAQQALLARQRFLEAYSPEKKHVQIHLPSNNDATIVHLGDIHFGSDSVNYQLLGEYLDWIENRPDTYLILYGDELEGIDPNKLDTNVTNSGLNFQQQVDILREHFRTLVDKGKILGTVGIYGGHNGWSSKHSSLNSTKQLFSYDTDGFKVAGQFVPILENGGTLTLSFPDGRYINCKLLHDPGSGSSDQKPLGAAINQANTTKMDHPLSPQIIGHGHLHRRAIGKLNYIDNTTGETRSTVLLCTSAFKGNENSLPDPFLVGKGRKRIPEPGAITIIRKDNIIPVDGLPRASRLQTAYERLDQLTSARLTNELIGEITEKLPKPTVEKIEDSFQHSLNHLNDRKRQSKHGLYDRTSYRIKTHLPISIDFFSNWRMGSSSFQDEKVTRLVKEVASNDYRFAFALGNLIEEDLAKSPNRYAVLDRLIKHLEPIDDTGALLGFLFSGAFRHKNWSKKMKDLEQKYTSSNGIEPSDYLRNNRLGRGISADYITHGSFANLCLSSSSIQGEGSPTYRFHILDHLNHFGSTKDPFSGLIANDVISRVTNDVVTGGHMPKSGVLYHPNAVFIAPGWESLYDQQGNSNRRKEAGGGQSVILMPDTRQVFAANSFSESTEMLPALTLDHALKLPEFRKISEKLAVKNTKPRRKKT